MVTTTKEDFEQFIASATDWCERLGCTRYRLDFAHVPLGGARGCATVNVAKRVALLEFSSELRDDGVDMGVDARRVGRHEALHVWFAELSASAHNGDSSWLVERTEEGMIREMEAMLDQFNVQP